MNQSAGYSLVAALKISNFIVSVSCDILLVGPNNYQTLAKGEAEIAPYLGYFLSNFNVH